MAQHQFLAWMAAHTPTKWCNDSAIEAELRSALECGAIGCTSNPPLSYQALATTPGLFAADVATLRTHSDVPLGSDAYAAQSMGIVVRYIAAILRDVYERTEHRHGYIRAQVQPSLAEDGEAMLAMGRMFASWAPNVMVKIPGTEAGVWVIEELAAEGIPTTPTVNGTISQIIAVAEAYERGADRAAAAGRTVAPSTAAIVLGRLQDYLSALNSERSAGVATADLECAAIALAKRAYQVFRERGFRQALMPAAFRCARQVTELVGADVVMTIHPSAQQAIIAAEAAGTVVRNPHAIDEPVDPAALDRVRRAMPEFDLAYEPGALAPREFAGYGANAMTLENFDKTGWQKLRVGP